MNWMVPPQLVKGDYGGQWGQNPLMKFCVDVALSYDRKSYLLQKGSSSLFPSVK